MAFRPTWGKHRRLSFECMESRWLLSGLAPMPTAEGEGDTPAPDFQLEDANTTSATFQQTVSPRDYLGKVSGWYFGFGT